MSIPALRLRAAAVPGAGGNPECTALLGGYTHPGLVCPTPRQACNVGQPAQPAMLRGEPWPPLRITSGHPRDEALTANSPKQPPEEAAPSALPLVGSAQGQPAHGRAQQSQAQPRTAGCTFCVNSGKRACPWLAGRGDGQPLCQGSWQVLQRRHSVRPPDATSARPCMQT